MLTFKDIIVGEQFQVIDAYKVIFNRGDGIFGGAGVQVFPTNVFRKRDEFGANRILKYTLAQTGQGTDEDACYYRIEPDEPVVRNKDTDYYYFT